MKNITVSVDDEVYREARVVAAQRDTSVSAMVRDYLQSVAKSSHFDVLKQREKELRRMHFGFSAADRLPREELYTRGRKP